MSTKRTQPTTVYRTIPQGKTQRATAEAIYDYLVSHPKDIPTSPRPVSSTKPHTVENLVFLLADSKPACIQFSDHNGLNLSVFPATTTNTQIERGWAANYGDDIGRGCLIENPHADRFRAKTTSPMHDREEVVRLIRIAIGRTLRHHAKEAARVAANIARREAERATEQTPDTLIHLHVPADAPDLPAAIEALTKGGVPTTVHRDGDSYFEWGEPMSADPDADDTTHVVIEVPSEHAAAAYGAIAQAGILVDATLAQDWSSRVTWGLGPEPDGWFTRYGDRIAV